MQCFCLVCVCTYIQLVLRKLRNYFDNWDTPLGKRCHALFYLVSERQSYILLGETLQETPVISESVYPNRCFQCLLACCTRWSAQVRNVVWFYKLVDLWNWDKSIQTTHLSQIIAKHPLDPRCVSLGNAKTNNFHLLWSFNKISEWI